MRDSEKTLFNNTSDIKRRNERNSQLPVEHRHVDKHLAETKISIHKHVLSQPTERNDVADPLSKESSKEELWRLKTPYERNYQKLMQDVPERRPLQKEREVTLEELAREVKKELVLADPTARAGHNGKFVAYCKHGSQWQDYCVMETANKLVTFRTDKRNLQRGEEIEIEIARDFRGRRLSNSNWSVMKVMRDRKREQGMSLSR